MKKSPKKNSTYDRIANHKTVDFAKEDEKFRKAYAHTPKKITRKAWMYEWPDGVQQVIWKRLLKKSSEPLKLKETRITISYEV